MNKHFLLNFTPTGMIPTKEMTPKVPVDPKEIFEQVLEAADLGANRVHLHARDREDGKPTYEKDIYAEMIAGIRARNKDLVICVSTSNKASLRFKQKLQAQLVFLAVFVEFFKKRRFTWILKRY